MSLKEANDIEGETDWDRVSSDTFDAPERDFDWACAIVVEPAFKKMVSIRLDEDLLAFFKGGGKGYQTRINAVLRSYMTAHKKI